jgi:crossover junction endodeoxyribonuclease RuvC
MCLHYAFDADTDRYPLSHDPTPCHTGWALYCKDGYAFSYGVIEPAKEITEDLPRMEHILAAVAALLPGPYAWAHTFVAIEGLAFAGRGSYALQLAGLGYMLRRQFRNAGILYKDVAPTQAKKFLTGKGNCDKNLILKEVYKRYGVDLEDDNIADAVNFNMIGRTLLGWRPADNKAQQEVVAMLLSPPKPKKGKKSKAA